MMSSKVLFRQWILAAACVLAAVPGVSAEKSDQMVRLAKLVIDEPQLAAYRSLLIEEIEASMRLEPGVRTLLCGLREGSADAHHDPRDLEGRDLTTAGKLARFDEPRALVREPRRLVLGRPAVGITAQIEDWNRRPREDRKR